MDTLAASRCNSFLLEESLSEVTLSRECKSQAGPQVEEAQEQLSSGAIFGLQFGDSGKQIKWARVRGRSKSLSLPAGWPLGAADKMCPHEEANKMAASSLGPPVVGPCYWPISDSPKLGRGQAAGNVAEGATRAHLQHAYTVGASPSLSLSRLVAGPQATRRTQKAAGRPARRMMNKWANWSRTK